MQFMSLALQWIAYFAHANFVVFSHHKNFWLYFVLLKFDDFFPYSLRSLCKTILNNTNPATASACDRAKVLVQILSKITQNGTGSDLNMTTSVQNGNNMQQSKIDTSKVLALATSVKLEQEEVQTLKYVLDAQGTLRPIFEAQLKQKRATRERALGLRKLVAEAGFTYNDLALLYDKSYVGNQNTSETQSQEKQIEFRRNALKASILEASDKDLEELLKLLDKHFIKFPKVPQTSQFVENSITSTAILNNTVKYYEKQANSSNDMIRH